MPQEEETLSEREENASPQPDDSRDRLFARFCEVTELNQILPSFRALCQEAGADPDSYGEVYPALKKSLTAWKPASIWDLLDKRAALPEYDSQTACRGSRVLVVGAGPVGLRMAVEAALLGARVDLVEKRDAFSRNNSLHLWPFLITDLRNLGAKKFYGKFASGSLDHICIRILQGILIKVCLLLGVRVHINVCFSSLIEPTSPHTGWRVSTKPSSCPVNTYEFDAILAADGKKNSLPGFKLKEFRAKLALAITANFVNGNTQHENSVPEISGVSYVYRMDFFNSLSEKYGIELENIVYYKDETHYFVMTAKKPSLLKKGVLKKDYNDPKQLLSPSNIDYTALKKYAVEAAEFSTEGALPLTFEKNHRGEDDIALFDFTSLFASENTARIVERKGHKILLCVSGDSLNEPFWPTGSGCGRGFLGAFDAVWMLKRLCAGTSPLELVEEREALFYLLPQTTPERLAKNLTGYTIDPRTRYPSLSELVPPGDVSYLYDTDNPAAKPVATQQAARQLPVQDPPNPLKETTTSTLGKAASVSGGLGRLASQRSRSSENLSAIAESTLATESASPAEPFGSSQKHKSREVSPAKHSPGSLRKKIQMLEAKETRKVPVRNKLKVDVKEVERRGETKQKKSAASHGREVSPTPLSGSEAEKIQKSPRSQKRGLLRLFDRSKSKSPSPTPSGEEQTKETEMKTRKGKGNIKESDNSHEHPHVGSTHPLSVTKQAQENASSHPESPKKDEERTQKTDDDHQHAPESVADIVKRLDPQKASAVPTEKKKKEKTKTTKREGRIKERDKQHPKDSAKESQEREGETKSSRFLSFFRSKKGYDVSKASSDALLSSTAAPSSSPKLKKKRKISEKEQVQSLSERPPLSVQHRIQRLKELGVGMIETDSPDISLEELRALEISSGITIEEKSMEEMRSRSVSPGYSDEGLESESSRSRSTSPVYSGADEPRAQSRTSQASAEVSRGTSPAEGDGREGTIEGEKKIAVEDGAICMSRGSLLAEGDKRAVEGDKKENEEMIAGEDGAISRSTAEGEERESEEKMAVEDQEDQEVQSERTASVVETVRRLEPLSANSKNQTMSRIQAANAQKRKSKEFELAELHSKSKADSSNPLWLARVIQGMGKSLERLRREQNNVLATKTTLQIISTILSNVQLHPGDDTYRRVRVSSQRFDQKVWQFSDASQFLARAGWVEIGDYIVLPMGQTVDIAKRVLDKHLNIVNQMLWSQQLELPDSPGVLQKLRGKGGVTRRNRTITAAMTTWRQSYSSRLVDESLQRVEKEQEAMEAVLVRMTSTAENGDRESSPDQFDPSSVSEERVEEVHTMRAASAARSKWMERQKKEAMEQRKDREYKLILESELYDLPQSSLQVPATIAKPSSPEPSVTSSPSLPITPVSTSTHPSTVSPIQQATQVSPASVSCTSPETEVESERMDEADTQSDGEKDGMVVVVSCSSVSPDTAAADAQYSTPDSIRQDMIQYEKITLEAAAQVRQKWRETQDSGHGGTKET